jgi:predicted Zn finger-like uncharacterized protein
MYTQCPECLTIYKVAADLLGQGHGSARCGHCAATFDVLRSLADALPDESLVQLPLHRIDSVPPQLTVPALRPQAATGNGQQSLLFDPDERMRRPPSQPRAATPAFARKPAAAYRSARTWPWALGSAALALALLAQIGYAKRAPLLDDTRLRPWFDKTCEVLGCRLPLRHDPARLTLLSRDIRPHPSVPSGLIISASLRNDAAFTQAFPDVDIVLSDLDENRIAMRRFHPQEYIGDARTIAAGMAPGATTALVFEVADPGKNAVAFEFKFR